MMYVAPEHEFEAVHGLPAALPAGENIIWQGSPDVSSFARNAFHIRALTGYFALLLMLRGAFAVADGASYGEALRSAAPLFALAVVGLGLVWLLAYLASRAAVYTLTDRRIVMRIGIVLSVTFNLPLTTLTAAGLKINSDGTGDIPLSLKSEFNIAYLHLWPHARPWQIRHTQPMLRSIANVERVAALLTKATLAVQPAIKASERPTSDAISHPSTALRTGGLANAS
jgi:Bacterial PH domain